MTITLITGPARSGKSEWAEQLAEQLAEQNDQQVVYIATAQYSFKDGDPKDLEWQARIETHKQRRPAHWQCEEVPIELAQVIEKSGDRTCLLVDSLGTWLANLIEQDNQTWDEEQRLLLTALEQTPATVVLVAEETGWGVVPAYKLGRTFRDRLGSLSRQVGAIAHNTYLVTSGYALNLSEIGQPVSSTPDNNETATVNCFRR